MEYIYEGMTKNLNYLKNVKVVQQYQDEVHIRHVKMIEEKERRGTQSDYTILFTYILLLIMGVELPVFHDWEFNTSN